MTTDIAQQRAADAAFFEDWSAWASLDDEPDERVRDYDSILGYHVVVRYGHRAKPNARRPRYYCELRRRIPCLDDSPGFELCVPTHEVLQPAVRIKRLLRAIPGARQHPSLARHDPATWAYYDNKWYVPAHQHDALRRALPAIKAATIAWVRR